MKFVLKCVGKEHVKIKMNCSRFNEIIVHKAEN